MRDDPYCARVETWEALPRLPKIVKYTEEIMIEVTSKKKEDKEKKPFFHSRGITYFDKKAERNLFFILTIVMLILGILYKTGWLDGH